MNTQEERNPKRPREPDSTLSPPPKKAHHKVSPRTEGSPTATSSLPLSADQPDTTGDAETNIGSVLISEGGTGKEFTPKERITINKSEEGAGDERLTPDEEIKTAIKCEGETDLKLEGETLKHDFTPESGLKTEPMCEEDIIKEESVPEEMADMDVSLEGKPDWGFTAKERNSKTESTNLQVDSDSKTAFSNVHSTAAPGYVAPHIPSLARLETEESISSTTGPLNDAKRTSRTEEEGRDHHSKKKKKKHSSQKSKKQNLSGEKKNVRPNYFVGIQVSNPAVSYCLLCLFYNIKILLRFVSFSFVLCLGRVGND